MCTDDQLKPHIYSSVLARLLETTSTDPFTRPTFGKNLFAFSVMTFQLMFFTSSFYLQWLKLKNTHIRWISQRNTKPVMIPSLQAYALRPWLIFYKLILVILVQRHPDYGKFWTGEFGSLFRSDGTLKFKTFVRWLMKLIFFLLKFSDSFYRSMSIISTSLARNVSWTKSLESISVSVCRHWCVWNSESRINQVIKTIIFSYTCREREIERYREEVVEPNF